MTFIEAAELAILRDISLLQSESNKTECGVKLNEKKIGGNEQALNSH